MTIGEETFKQVDMPASSTGYFVKVYPERCIKIIEDALRTRGVGEMLDSVIQKFDGCMTGTASWRRAMRPDVFAGNRAEVVGKKHNELKTTVVPYKEHDEPVVIRNIHYSGKRDALTLRFEPEELRSMAPVHCDLFPANRPFVKFSFGHNVHGRQIDKRFELMFGEDWAEHAEIVAQKSAGFRIQSRGFRRGGRVRQGDACRPEKST